MISYKTSARMVGALFLIVFATSLIGSGFVEDIMDATDYLNIAYLNKTTWIIGLLIHLISVIGTVGIVILMFPILKQQSIQFAIAYLVFRSIEAIMITNTELSSLSILTLSQEFIKSGSSDTSSYSVLGATLQGDRSWHYSVAVMFFCTGSLFYYTSLFKSKILPSFISVWGLIACILALTANTLSLLGIKLSLGFLFYIPIALNEIVMSIWLIFKGFDSSKLIKEEMIN